MLLHQPGTGLECACSHVFPLDAELPQVLAQLDILENCTKAGCDCLQLYDVTHLVMSIDRLHGLAARRRITRTTCICCQRHSAGHLVNTQSCNSLTRIVFWIQLSRVFALGFLMFLDVYQCSLRKLDEKVAALHLPALGASLTKLSKEQAEYIGVKPEGPRIWERQNVEHGKR